MSALDIQVGGDHYKNMPIQPMEYSMANGLDACQHTIIKYVTRFRDKGGIQDLEKARHVIDMLIEFERKASAPSKAANDNAPPSDVLAMVPFLSRKQRAIDDGRCASTCVSKLCRPCKIMGRNSCHAASTGEVVR
jgi:hypothetical protein